MTAILLLIAATVTVAGAAYELSLLAVSRAQLTEAVTRRLRGGDAPLAWPVETERELAAASAFTSIGMVMLGVLLPGLLTTDSVVQLLVLLLLLAVPFAIVVGTERMLVTSVTPGNWTVQRGQGGTDSDVHFTNDRVMSTPLPLIESSSLSTDASERQRQTKAGYAVGKQAQMCVASPTSTAWPSSTYDMDDVGDGFVWGKF